MNPTARRVVFLLCTGLWAGMIWYLSDQPSLHVSPMFGHQDKLMHLAAYAVLGCFMTGSLQRHATDRRTGVTVAAVVLAGLYGLLDEYHQSFVPGRDADLLDALADVTGGVLGSLLMMALARRPA